MRRKKRRLKVIPRLRGVVVDGGCEGVEEPLVKKQPCPICFKHYLQSPYRRTCGSATCQKEYHKRWVNDYYHRYVSKPKAVKER